MGIEPPYIAWKASVLPLNYTRICCYEVFNVIYISRYLGMCQGGGGDFLVSVNHQEKFVVRGSTFHSGPRRSEVPRTSCAALAKQTRKGIGMQNTHAWYPRVCTHLSLTFLDVLLESWKGTQQTLSTIPLSLELSPLSPLPLSQNKNEKKTGSYICHADIPLPIFFVFILQP